ncbi:WXG100 family type VII secretion target [Streptosporangium soli]|nr:hypothetical protein [Streptosporangium sp. KLBMP 9127]
MSAASALLIPSALPMAGQMLMMAGDPSAMRSAAGQWRSEQSSGSLVDLGADLAEQARLIKDDGNWKGASHAAFETRVDEFQGYLTQLDERRRGVADSLDGAADLYNIAGAACFVAGGAVSVLSFASKLLLANPPAWFASRPGFIKIGMLIARGVGAVANLQMKFVFKASLLLTGVSYLYSATAAKFPSMEAIKLEAPQFTSAALVYDPASGGLTQSTVLDPNALKPPSMMPNFTI